MYELRLVQDRQRVEQLRREHLDELCAQPSKRVLLDELVQIGREQFEDQTKVGFMDECIP